MALDAETKKLQQDQNAKFPDLTTVPQKNFFEKMASDRSFANFQYDPTNTLSINPIVVPEVPNSYERRLGPFYDPTVSSENLLANQQSGWERASYMVPRIAAKTLSEVAQLPGYLGGAVAWGIHGFEKNDIGLLVDNAWQQSIQNIEQDVKDRLPVYVSDALKSGSLIKNIFSTSFWANEGADGIGFLLAFLAPGAALRGIGLGEKTAMLLKPGTTFMKGLRAGALPEEVAAGLAGTKFAANINDITSTLINTVFESAAEGGQSYNTILEKTGDKEKAANAAVDVLTKNFGILGISNYIDQKWLFGKAHLISDYAAKNTAELATGSMFRRVLGEQGALLDAVAKRTTMANISKVANTVTEGFVKEGFWEEGMQFAAQKNAEKGEENDQGFINELLDIGKTYVDNLGDVDMQKSIFLGGVMGSGMASVSTVREMKREDKILTNFHSLVKDNFIDRYRNISDLAVTDANGPVFNDDGTYKIDEVKAQEQLSKHLVKYIQGKQLIQLAKEGNTEAFEKLKNERDLNYFFPFLQVEGGLEAAINHIDALAETDVASMQKEGVPVNLEDVKKELKDKVVGYQNIYNRIENSHDLNMNIKYSESEKPMFKEFSDIVKNNKLGAEATIQYSASRVTKLRNELANFKASDTTPVSITSDETKYIPKVVSDLKQSLKEQKSSLTPIDLININSIIKNIDGHIKGIEVSKDKLQDLYTKKTLQNEFESYRDWKIAKAKGTVEKAATEEKAKVVVDQKTEIENSRTTELNNIVEEQVDPKQPPIYTSGEFTGTKEEVVKLVNEKYDKELESLTPKAKTKKVLEKVIQDGNYNDLETVRQLLSDYEVEAKHPFSIVAGANNWFMSTGDQRQAVTNDDIARWYLFVNNIAYQTDSTGRYKYVLRSFTADQVGKLDVNDIIRKTLTFWDGKSLKTYDQLNDKNSEDIKLVVFDRNGKVVPVSKLGEVNTKDQSQIIQTSLPLPSTLSAKGFDRFSTRNEKVAYFKSHGITKKPTKEQEKEAEEFVQGEITKSLETYRKERVLLETTQTYFDISRINPGEKLTTGAIDTEVLDAIGITKAKALYRRIHVVARKEGKDAFTSKVENNISGATHGLVNGYWYLITNNRFELIKPKKIGDSVDNVVRLIQEFAKDTTNKDLRNFIGSLMYTGVNDATGKLSPYRLQFEYNRDEQGKIISDVTSLVYGSNTISIEELAKGENLDLLKTFIRDKYWNFDNNYLDATNFTEYFVNDKDEVKTRIWEVNDGGYKGFLFSPENNNVTKGTVYVRPRYDGLKQATEEQYRNQSIQLTKVGTNLQVAAPKNTQSTWNSNIKSESPTSTFVPFGQKAPTVNQPKTEEHPMANLGQPMTKAFVPFGQNPLAEPITTGKPQEIKNEPTLATSFKVAGTQPFTPFGQTQKPVEVKPTIIKKPISQIRTGKELGEYDIIEANESAGVKGFRKVLILKGTGSIDNPTYYIEVWAKPMSEIGSPEATHLSTFGNFSIRGDKNTGYLVFEESTGIGINATGSTQKEAIQKAVEIVSKVGQVKLNETLTKQPKIPNFEVIQEESSNQALSRLESGELSQEDEDALMAHEDEMKRLKNQSKQLTPEEYWKTLSLDKQTKYLDQTKNDFNVAIKKAYLTYLLTLDKTGLDREATLFDSYKKENLNSTKEWLKEKFPNIPVEIVDGLIDNKSWGRLTKSAKILLSSIAEEGTGYHEGFHTFSQLVLTDVKRKELYDEVRRRLPGQTALVKGEPETIPMSAWSDKEVEEILAEEFRIYMLSPSYYTFGKQEINRRDFFQKLWDLILSFFNISNKTATTNQIENTFAILKNGQFDVVAKELPMDFDKKVDRNRIEGLTDKETLLFVRDINYMFFKILFEPRADYTETALFGQDNNFNDVYDAVANYYDAMGETEGKDSFHAKISENFNKLVEEHLRFLKLYKINIKKLTNDEEDESDEDQREDNTNYTYKDHLNINIADIVDNQVRFLIAGLPSMTKDSSILSNLSDYKTRSTVNFNKIMNTLLDNLSNLGTDPEEYFDKIRELIKLKPESERPLAELLDRLKVNDKVISKNILLLRAQFVRAFANNKANPLLTNLQLDGSKNTFNAVEKNLHDILRTQWLNQARSVVDYAKSFILRTKDSRGVLVIDTNKLQKAIANANTAKPKSREQLNEYLFILKGLGITISNNFENVYNYDVVKSYLDRLTQEISSKGGKSNREFTPENITSLQSNEVFVFGSNAEGAHGKGAALTAKQRFGAKQGQAVGIQGQSYAIITKKNWRVEKSSTLSEIGDGIDHMIEFAIDNPNKKFYVTKIGVNLAGYTIPEIKSLFAAIKDVIPNNVILPKEFEVRPTETKYSELLLSDLFNADIVKNQKETKELIAYARKFLINDTDLSFYNQDGNKEYSNNLNSHTTDIMNLLNKISYDYKNDKVSYPEGIEQLLPYDGTTGNLFSRNSVWGDHLMSNGKIKVVDLKGLIDQFNSKNSSEISKATFGDYKMITFNALLNGMPIHLRSADRKRELAFQYVDENGNASKVNYNITQDYFKQKMIGYLKDELATSFALLTDPVNWGGDLLHYSENAKQLRTFNFLYDIELNGEIPILPLQQFVDSMGFDETQDTIEQVDKMVENYLTTNANYLSQSFDRYLNKMSELTEASLKEDGLVKENFTKDNQSMGIYIPGIDLETLANFNIVPIPGIGIINHTQLNKLILFANYTQFIGSQEQLKFIMGDMAMWKDTTDFHKRVNGATSPKSKLTNSSEFRQQMDSLYTRVDGKSHDDSMEIVVVNDIISSNKDLKKQFSEYGEIKGTDAQSWATLDEYRDIMIHHGLWYPSQEKTYQFEQQKLVLRLLKLKDEYLTGGRDFPFLKTVNKEMFTNPNGVFYQHTNGVFPKTPMFEGKELKEFELGVLSIQKPQGFGSIKNVQGLNAVQFFKTSTAPIFPSSIDTENPLFETLLSMMDNKQGILTFNSAMKGTVIGNQTLDTKTGYQSQQLSYNDFGLQLDISDEVKEEVTVSTQRTRLEFLDIFSNGKLVKNQKLADLRTEYVKLVNEIVDLERQQLIDDLGLKWSVDKDSYELVEGEESKDKFKKKLIEAFDFALMPYNIIDGLNLALDSAEKVFDVTVSKFKIEEILSAMVRRDVIGRKTKGDMLVQEAGLLYDPSLKFYRIENGVVMPMEVMISLPKELQSISDNLGGLDQLNNAIGYHQGYNKDDKAGEDVIKLGEDFFKMLDIPMNRIPAQSLSSLDIGRVKSFLPSYHGVKIILPPEITTKAGTDFDVDKMTSYFHYFGIEDGKVKYYTDLNKLEGKKNRLNQISIETLLDPERFDELVHPLTSKTIKKLIGEAEKKLNKTSVEIESSSTGNKQGNKWENVPTWWYNMQKGNEFFRLKRGVSSGAVHNAANALGQIHPIKMNALVPLFFKNQIHTKQSTDKLGNPITVIDQSQFYNTGFMYDSDDYLISGNFGEFLSAFVDAVKDPFIFNLTDDFTFNTVAFLNRYGKDSSIGLESIVSFMTQDSIKDYLRVRRANTPKFLAINQYHNNLKPSFKLKLNFEEQYNKTVEIIKQKLGGTDTDIPILYEDTIASSLYKLLSIPEDSPSRQKYLDEIRDKVIKYKYRGFATSTLNSKEIRTNFHDQIQILDNFLTYQILGQNLVQLNLQLRPDAKGSMGRHISAIEANYLIPQENIENKGLFVLEDIGNMIGTEENKTLLTEFYKTQTSIKTLFGWTSLVHKDPIVANFFENTIYTNFADPEKWKNKKEVDKVITEVESDFLTFIMADSLDARDYKEQQNIYQYLFTGNNSIPTQLLELKKSIQGNLGIQELEPRISERLTKSRTLSETDNISLFNKNFDIQILDLIESSLYDLGVETNPANQKFIYELMFHSVFQSGFHNAANSYLSVIPNRLFIDIAEKAIGKFRELSDEAKSKKLESFYEQLFRNNAHNTKIVPRSPWTVRNGKSKFGYPKTFIDGEVNQKTGKTKKAYYTQYDYISFNYNTYDPRSFKKRGLKVPKGIVLYRRVNDNTFEAISKQGDGPRMREYYPMLNAGDLDNVSILESNRYNRLTIDTPFVEDTSEDNNPVNGLSGFEDDFMADNEALPFSFNADMVGRDNADQFIPDEETNSYFKVLKQKSTVQQALGMIERNSKNPAYRDLAKVLRNAIRANSPLIISRTKFETLDNTSLETGRPKSTGYYFSDTNRTYVYEKITDDYFEEVLLHEAVHVLAQREYDKGEEFSKKIDRLAEYTKYLLANPNASEYAHDILEQFGFVLGMKKNEFLTYALTNSDFQAALAQLPSENPEKTKDILQQSSILKEFLDTLFDLITKYFNILFGTSMPDYNNKLKGQLSVIHDLVALVQEDLLPLIQEDENPITPSTPEDIKVDNTNELAKEVLQDFDTLYPDYEYLNSIEQEAFTDAVSKGIIELNCGI